MIFKEAFELIKQGKKIKLPSWGGYWAWGQIIGQDKNTIMMHCKDGRLIDIKNMEDVEFTLNNICSDEWIEATEENIKINYPDCCESVQVYEPVKQG